MRGSEASSLSEGRSDVNALDSTRVLAQLTVKLTRLPRERRQWVSSVSSDLSKLDWWIRSLVLEGARAILFDLDGTLAHLPVDWKAVKQSLMQRGLIEPWEGVVEALRRLWASDKPAYEEASLIVEEAELEAVEEAKPLVDVIPLANLSVEVKVVTLQSSRSARKVLGSIGFKWLCNRVVGRDSETGPYKELVYRSAEKPSLVVEDSLRNTVSAMRAGHLPILVARDAYTRARALRLGIPSIPHALLLRQISLILGPNRGGVAS